MFELKGVIAMVAGALACVYDTRTGKIPNAVTYGGGIAGLVLAVAVPPPAVTESFLAALLGLSTMYVFWHFGMIGGGDVKLVAMVGALKGLFFLAYFLFYAFAFTLALVAFLGISEIGLWRFSAFFGRTLLSILVFRPFPRPPEALQGIRVPFGAVSFAAIVVCMGLEYSGRLQLLVL